MLVAVDYLPGAYMFCKAPVPEEPVHFAVKGTEPSSNSGIFLLGIVILISLLGCAVLILLVSSDERQSNLSETSGSVSSSQVSTSTSNATISSSKVTAKAILAQDVTLNDIPLHSSEWRYRCHALRVFARCSSANLPDPPNTYYYTSDTMGNGECQAWVNGDECLVENYNAFAKLADCRKECENRSGNRENSDRCSTVVSRPCIPADRKLEYIYYKDKSGKRSACVKLPGKKCTTREYGFATMQECRAACHPRSIGNDTRCKTGAHRRECQRNDRKYPFYYDDEEGKCLPWTDICLVSGFADKASCEIHCKSR